LAVDTGGLSGVEEAIDVLTARQVRLAIEEAQVLVFVVDARDGLLPQDHVILGELRRSGKPIIAAVNKIDGLMNRPPWRNSLPSAWPPPCRFPLRMVAAPTS